MTSWNIAHRGGAGLNPENTLAAFADAVARGCDGAELDVQLSADGAVVVFHDWRLKPAICRDGSGAWISKPAPLVKALTLAALTRYDIGRADPRSEYARGHPRVVPRDGQRIPTLDSVVEVAKTAVRPFHLFIELKTSYSDRSLSADPAVLAEATLDVLAAHGYLDRAVLVGFDWPGLIHAKARVPEVACWFTTLPQSWFADRPPPDEDGPLSAAALMALRHWAKTGTSPWAGGFDAVNYGGSILEAMKAAGADGWFPFYRDASESSVAEAKCLGLKVGAWTVDDVPVMRALVGRGLDAICTDRPDLLAEVQTG